MPVHDRPIKFPLLPRRADEFVRRLVEPYGDAGSIIVAALPTIARYVKGGGAPVCRSQLSRLIACAISLNAKYWDDGAAGGCLNMRVCSATGIPLEEFAAMEIEMLDR